MKPFLKKSNQEEIELLAGINFWKIPFISILMFWLIFWLGERMDVSMGHYGILPRNLRGLPGIVFSPFIHGSFQHLLSNTLPFLLLGSGIGYFYYRSSLRIFLVSWLATGILVWLIGRTNYHIGASGMVYAFAAFIFFSGLIRGHPRLIALSLLVAFLYGSLIWGVLPLEEGISWESHLSGGIVGLVLAIGLRKANPLHLHQNFWKKDNDFFDEDEDTEEDEDTVNQKDINFDPFQQNRTHSSSDYRDVKYFYEKSKPKDRK